MPANLSGSSRNPATTKTAFWYDPRKRSIVYQLGVLAMVGLLGYYLISNTQANLERQSIATGFGFLQKEAAFEIGESLIPYSAANTYARALLVGALNTLKVAFLGIVLTVILVQMLPAEAMFIAQFQMISGLGLLNSLAGEAIPASLGLLRPYGRFLEIGKRDIVDNSGLPLRAFNQNLPYDQFVKYQLAGDLYPDLMVFDAAPKSPHTTAEVEAAMAV